jgi:hypothetical protein
MTFAESDNNTRERQECFIQKEIGLEGKYIGIQVLELSFVLKWKPEINA